MLSVVIPVKDDAPALRRCLEALSRQTRHPDEIVVVDNASTDASADVAAQGGARVIPCATPGIAAASACGYNAARGDVILRLDADCIPAPDWIETVVAAFVRRPTASVVTGGAVFTDGPPRLRRPLAALYLGAYVTVGFVTLGHAPLFGSNLAFTRRAWLRVRDHVHRSDPELHDDLDLSFHLGEYHRVRLIPARTMGISMRPFDDPQAFARRIARGFRTVITHWPYDLPPLRWDRRLLRRTLAAARRRDRPASRGHA
ncbi:glycosyltransferase family A protein [Microbacterium awajiense]|uniref:Glycosyltransferase family A protein n=1 Tax=Microbacterium awajiense TaxID=415214 RepID=A0ABP7AHP4_9MICO